MQPGPAAASSIKVYCTFGLRSIIQDLAGPFERASGHGIELVFDATPNVMRRVREGEAADVVLVARGIAEELAADGCLGSGDIHDVARSNIGVAVRAGAPKLDISTPDAFKRMLLGARKVVYTDPASGGASGVHFAAILEKLGIANEMKPKSILNVGSYNCDLVVRGEADVAIQQIAEILPVEGVELLGPVPDGLQVSTVFVAAIGGKARSPGAALELVQFVKSAAAASTIAQRGMQQV